MTDLQAENEATSSKDIDSVELYSRRPGRPRGVQMRVSADRLGRHHFSFLRSQIEGLPLRTSWEQYLAFEGGPNDERHFAARLRKLMRQVRLAAAQRGMSSDAESALTGIVVSAAPIGRAGPELVAVSSPPCPPLPSIEDWVVERCAQSGIDEDFQTQAEWRAEYEAEFGLNVAAVTLKATSLVDKADAAVSLVKTSARNVTGQIASPLSRRLEALNRLSTALARPPEIEDRLELWLAPELAGRLSAARAGTKRDANPLPVVTIGDLIAFINLFGNRWWTRVQRVGSRRAERLTSWLKDVATGARQPLMPTSLQPFARQQLAREAILARIDLATTKRWGIVPLDRLSVPPELNGAMALFRVQKANTLGASTDLEAITAWLNRHRKVARTHLSYSRIVERFYLWAILVKAKPLGSLTEPDISDFAAFLAAPPTDWIQEQHVRRNSTAWRPFKRSLGLSTQRLNLSVVAAMMGSLHKAGYLNANAADGVVAQLKLPVAALNPSRSFDDQQWHWIMECWDRKYRDVGPADSGRQALFPDANHPDRKFQRAAELRRLRLILELGSTTGLRLLEFVTSRLRALTRHQIDGELVWILEVSGKGRRSREVRIYDDIKDLIDAHHADMEKVGTDFDPEVHTIRTLGNAGASPVFMHQSSTDRRSVRELTVADSTSKDRRNFPLIGALRRAPPRWMVGEHGQAVKGSRGSNADRYGALDPTAAYQSLKRFFSACADAVAHGPADLDANRLRLASTHWMRHFFANSAVADGVPEAALMLAMGHADLKTTSIYVHPERRLVVKAFGEKLRRRR